uniref:Serine/arginine-rich splicing factor 2 n=1 Tax=Panagrellus redivivus TaxID=6233 RepID=A0A7E4VAC6_PANRE
MSYRDRGDRDSYRNGGGGGGGDRPRGPPPAISGLHSLKVDNISYQTTQSELRRLFERYGEIGDVHIPRDRRSRQSRGFGFVRFTSRRDAEYAVTKMDGRHVDGRDIRVSFAKYDRPIDEGDRREGGGRRPLPWLMVAAACSSWLKQPTRTCLLHPLFWRTFLWADT